jgi:hypothetical protein
MILRAVALLALLAMHAITNYKELKKQQQLQYYENVLPLRNRAT